MSKRKKGQKRRIMIEYKGGLKKRPKRRKKNGYVQKNKYVQEILNKIWMQEEGRWLNADVFFGRGVCVSGSEASGRRRRCA
jgi:hypothetical protein